MHPSNHSLAAGLAALAACPAAPAQADALQFTNGFVSQHVEVPYDPGLLPTRALTIEAWITYDDSTVPRGQGGRWPTIARQDVRPGGESYFLRVAANTSSARKLDWTINNGSGSSTLSYSFGIGEFKTWTHIAATYDGRNSALYVNGVQVARRGVGGDLRDNQGVLRIGEGDSSTPGLECWHGAIDEFRIWPFARSAPEILEGMQYGIRGLPGITSFNLDNGTVADSSGGRSGTLVGGTWVAGVPNMPTRWSGAVSHGAETNFCNQTSVMTAGSLPVSGNNEFSLAVYDGPSGFATALFAAQLLQTPIVGGGIAFHLDPSTLLVASTPGLALTSGITRYKLSIPSTPALIGKPLAAQFAYRDTVGCGSNGVMATRGFGFVVQ